MIRRSCLVSRPVSAALVSAALSMSIVSALPTRAHAQDADSHTDVTNSRYQFDGVVNANSTFIRSGASDSDYATTKLDAGAHVTVVGARFTWLKILPPEGSFCYVAQAFVERRDNGDVGRVTSPLNVHYGSELNDLKMGTAARLDANTDVHIIGKEDIYFKIKPPAGVYYYVAKQFVTPVQPVTVKTGDDGEVTVVPVKPVDPQPLRDKPKKSDAGNETVVVDQPTTQPTPKVDVAGATTQPGNLVAATTQPDSAAAQAEFDKLEADFAVDGAKPLTDQHPAELSEGFDKLAKGGGLPDSMRKVAEYRAAILKAHADDQKNYLAVKKQQEEELARMASLKAERQELEDRVKKTQIKSYAAVGTLRPSSLQQGNAMLYRLTDPSSGRTVLYVRSNDTKVGTLMNQFVGVQGTVADDAALSLKVIEPTGIEPVDQNQLFKSVMSTIIPPSLEPTGSASLAP